MHYLIRQRRIMIVGSPGSGKTTLGRQLKAYLSLPLISLDDIGPAHAAGTIQAHGMAIAAERWVIEGNHLSLLRDRLERAQCVIMFELPMLMSFVRMVLRGVKRLIGNHEAMDRPQRVDPTYRCRPSWRRISYQLRWNREVGAAIANEVTNMNGLHVIRLRTSREVAYLLDSLRHPADVVHHDDCGRFVMA